MTLSSSTSPMLAVRGLSKTFGGLKAVQDISFDVGAGEIVGLIGPNGAGKTTCFNLITGFYTPTSGKVHFKGTKACCAPSFRARPCARPSRPRVTAPNASSTSWAWARA